MHRGRIFCSFENKHPTQKSLVQTEKKKNASEQTCHYANKELEAKNCYEQLEGGLNGNCNPCSTVADVTNRY